MFWNVFFLYINVRIYNSTWLYTHKLWFKTFIVIKYSILLFYEMFETIILSTLENRTYAIQTQNFWIYEYDALLQKKIIPLPFNVWTSVHLFFLVFNKPFFFLPFL